MGEIKEKIPFIDVDEVYYFSHTCGECKYFHPDGFKMDNIESGYCMIDESPTFSNSLADCFRV